MNLDYFKLLISRGIRKGEEKGRGMFCKKGNISIFIIIISVVLKFVNNGHVAGSIEVTTPPRQEDIEENDGKVDKHEKDKYFVKDRDSASCSKDKDGCMSTTKQVIKRINICCLILQIPRLIFHLIIPP